MLPLLLKAGTAMKFAKDAYEWLSFAHEAVTASGLVKRAAAAAATVGTVAAGVMAPTIIERTEIREVFTSQPAAPAVVAPESILSNLPSCTEAYFHHNWDGVGRAVYKACQTGEIADQACCNGATAAARNYFRPEIFAENLKRGRGQ